MIMQTEHLKVTGMTCGGCTNNVTHALQAIEGADDVEVSLAAGAGTLSPILTYWISAKAASAHGWELGKQTPAASLGVTLGSAAGGLLFNVAALPGASFVLTSMLATLGLASF
jgi:copper chaperone CopZ